MMALFLLAATLQWNDPDPYLWMALYLVPALISLVEGWRWIPDGLFVNGRKILWVLVTMSYLVYGLSLFQGLEKEWYNDEITRESGGLFLVALHGMISFWMLPGRSGGKQE